jgi:hypothetical protein
MPDQATPYVFGMKRNPCLRNGPRNYWRTTADEDGHYCFAVTLRSSGTVALAAPCTAN